MIDLTSLRSLIAVRDLGTVASAAASLDFTPSAVSQQIKRLERQTGSALLERVGRRVLLTEHGRLVADRGVALLGDLEALESIAHAPDAPLTGTFRIASFSTANRGLVAPLIARLRRMAPALRVTTTEMDPWDVLEVLERGRADMGLVHNWNTVTLDVPPSLATERLFDDRVDVLVPADHRFADRAAVTPAELGEETWVSTLAGTICHQGLCQLLAGAGHHADIAYYDADYTSHIAMVDAGISVALLPRLGRPSLPDGVVPVPVQDTTPFREVSAVWRRSTAENPALASVRRELAVLITERE
ncbi:DNA-binding transcriptional LysR family regulator [Labedella gwakjiensis]|uniref:DNA-binding transcriptional LysR family regulator n=1 Tax=Labedella gwakjiensis TaxID=390269 RepID=A0A2P8GZL6_9MICO|nr:LysR family transcriptional regulator [Labedella gwakjiensis]PSL39398.1 DNA-binding transcriptional LysR family regulator [Labedella gwakjiensis]RUQ86194.1 LysR family transcriptional regulator [Labedella gwakjiensis]